MILNDSIICINGNLSKTYPTITAALKDAKPEQKDVIIIFCGVSPEDLPQTND